MNIGHIFFYAKIKITLIRRKEILGQFESHSEVSECGIVVFNNGQRVLFDPRRESKADVMFFSHAHSDHLMTAGKGRLLMQEKF